MAYKDAKIIQMPDLDYLPDPRGMGYVFFAQMLKYKNNIAQIDAKTERKETFESLLLRCIRTAIKIRERGISSEDIVALCTYNHLNSCVPFFSALFLGAKVASLDPTLNFSDMLNLLKQATPRIIFAHPEAVGLIEKAVQELPESVEIVVFGSTNTHVSFLQFLTPSPEEVDFRPVEIENQYDTGIIFFSSGTTGTPKGICINHFHFLSQLENFIRFGFCLDIMLNYTSMYWVSGTSFVAMSILTGKSLIIVEKFDETSIWMIIEKLKPTILCSTPYHLISMINSRGLKSYNSSSLKHVLIGGTPLKQKHILTIRKVFPTAEVCGCYGQTEVAMLLTVCKANDHLGIAKLGSSGNGILGVTYKVVDPETEETLGANQPGELRVKTKWVMNGYCGLDSSANYAADGWFKTGDIVYYDEDGWFYVVDRIKEFFKFQNWHVQPHELEELLLTHPAVSHSVVIGIPHEIDGEHPMAVVVLGESHRHVTAEEIRQFVDERVHYRKQLRGGVKIVDHVSFSLTGKVRRRENRDMVLRNEL